MMQMTAKDANRDANDANDCQRGGLFCWVQRRKRFFFFGLYCCVVLYCVLFCSLSLSLLSPISFLFSSLFYLLSLLSLLSLFFSLLYSLLSLFFILSSLLSLPLLSSLRYEMECFGTYFTHAQACNVTRVQSATECFGTYL